MRIGLAQTFIIWEEKAKNLERMETLLSQADADAVFFPEMSLTGFSMHTELTAEENEESVERVKRLAVSYGMHIGFGWVKKTEPLCENHYSVVSPDGTMILDYAKIHPFSYSGENQFFQSGDTLAVGKLNDFSVGLAICYDLRFPELFRSMMPAAELVIVPANWPERRVEHYQALLMARAIENQCFIAGVNCCGMMDGQFYSGDSGIYAPDGKKVPVLQELSPSDAYCKEEKLLVFDIENTVLQTRNAFPVLDDRKEMSFFSHILKKS